MSTFAENLREAMDRRQISQAELCKRTGISKSFISQYLSGKFKPRDDKLAALAQALGTTKGALLGYESGKVNKVYETDNLIKVPVYSADEPEKSWGEEYITAEPGEYVFYICRDDKHRPFIMSGDCLLVSVREIGGAGIYAVKRDDGRIIFRELKNPREEIPTADIIGRVCEIRRRL
ncbi:MAG: helix-turn-helix transcriptional regulator [Ruminococcus sp.]|nr:helix-turn-helix transcriptional regulator [Ruminococcus sp.]